MFYGFVGRLSTTGQLSGLGMIGYDVKCVKKFKDELGDDFIWFTPELKPEPEVPIEEKEKKEETGE